VNPGITKAAISARLAELVDLGLLQRRPYQEPGQRLRNEYVLTGAGTDFMPVVWAMFGWGRHHLPQNSRLRLTHLAAGRTRWWRSAVRRSIGCPPTSWASS